MPAPTGVSTVSDVPDLLDPRVRLHVVTGKGGTGKTTVAAALALALARRGRRVLLCEVEGRQGLARLFDVDPLPYAPTPLVRVPGGELLGLAIEAKAALLEYLEVFYRLGRAGRALERVGAVDFATTIAPGLRDVLLTGKVYDAVRTRQGSRRGDTPYEYDHVVLDAPPTGRIGNFLNVNAVGAGLAKVGPIHTQAESVMKVLRSSATRVHLVTLLEDMPVQETADAVAELRGLGLPLGTLLLNQVRPPLLDDDLLAAAATGTWDTDGAGRGAHRARRGRPVRVEAGARPARRDRRPRAARRPRGRAARAARRRSTCRPSSCPSWRAGAPGSTTPASTSSRTSSREPPRLPPRPPAPASTSTPCSTTPRCGSSCAAAPAASARRPSRPPSRCAAPSGDDARSCSPSTRPDGSRSPSASPSSTTPPARSQGVEATGEGFLDAMMLDMKRTFDEVVEAHATPEKAEQMLANPFYQALSSSFAGTQEYMAMEKLGQLRAVTDDDGRERWDLVVVDTPPSRSALDFLDAPERLGSFLDGRLLRLLLAPAKAGGRAYVRVLSSIAGGVTGVMNRILGAQVLTDVQTFVAAFDTMFGGFRERAQQTYALLAGEGTAFVVVAAPEGDAVREAGFFVERLQADRMPLAGVVVNRMTTSTEADLDGRRDAGGGRGQAGPGTREVLWVHARRVRRLEAEREVAARLTRLHPPVPTVVAPARPLDVTDLESLRGIGEDLATGPVVTPRPTTP